MHFCDPVKASFRACPKLRLEGMRKARRYAVSVARLRTSFEARNLQIKSILCYSLDSDV
jgi:hypothetical protein